jgi:hypothetical protein
MGFFECSNELAHFINSDDSYNQLCTNSLWIYYVSTHHPVTQPLTEMSTRNIKIIMLLGSKVRRVGRADNLTAIYEPIV